MPLNQKSLKHLFEEQLKAYFEAHEGESPSSGLYQRIVEEVECSLIKETLHATKGNQVKAAEILGINRNTLRRKMEQHKLLPALKSARRRRSKA